MNWYKIAQQKNKGLVPSDMFAFYAANTLSDKALLNNEQVFVDAINRTNQMRAYYLEYLKKEIVEELEHAIHDTTVSMDAQEAYEEGDTRLMSDDYVSFDVFLELLYPEATMEDLEKNFSYHDAYDDFLSREVEYYLAPETKNRIENIIQKFSSSENYSYTLIQDVKNIFTSLPWSKDYGGKNWAEITQWFWVLYNSSPIDVSSIYNELPTEVVNHYRYLTRVLDTINSLYHNNANVLADLPFDERSWLVDVLDIIKHSSNEAALAFFTEDENLSKAVRKDFMSQGKNLPSNRQDFIISTFQKMAKEIMREKHLDFTTSMIQIVSNISHLPILRTLLSMEANAVDTSIWMGLLENSYLWQHENLAIQFIQKLIQVYGIERTSYLLQEVGSKHLPVGIQYTQELLQYLSQLDIPVEKGTVTKYLRKHNLI